MLGQSSGELEVEAFDMSPGEFIPVEPAWTIPWEAITATLFLAVVLYRFGRFLRAQFGDAPRPRQGSFPSAPSGGLGTAEVCMHCGGTGQDLFEPERHCRRCIGHGRL